MLSLPHGEVLTTDDRVGGALWIPSDKSEIGLAQRISLLPIMIRAVSLRGLKRLMGVIDAMDKVHPHEAHYHLQFIGIDPDHQGKGLGSALIQPMMERCDREGCGAYLENTKEENFAFYERFGFTVTDELDLGPGAPPVWCMWRAPR